MWTKEIEVGVQGTKKGSAKGTKEEECKPRQSKKSKEGITRKGEKMISKVKHCGNNHE